MLMRFSPFSGFGVFVKALLGSILRLRIVLCSVLLCLPALGQPAQVVPGSVPPICTTLQSVGSLEPTQMLSLAIGLPLRNQSALNTLLAQLYDGGSTKYRHFLTPDQFAAAFGPSEQDYQTLVAFLQTQGLAVFNNRPGRILVDVNGTVADIEKLFHVHLLIYQHPTEARTFYAPDTEPSINLSVPIHAITGLNNYLVPTPSAGTASGSGPNGTFLGKDFRAAYAPGVPLTGAGQTIALVGAEGLFLQTDISAYEQAAGLPNIPIIEVKTDGCGNCSTSDLGDCLEITMDIELVISMAPGLSAVVVYNGGGTASSSWFDDCLDSIASPPAGVPFSYQISVSYGHDKDSNTPQLYQRFAAQGQSYFNGSGDKHGIAPGTPPSGGVFYPDDDYETVVGGTSLSTQGPGGAWVSESVWNDLSGGSTGGYSLTNPIPSWQAGISMQVCGGSTTYRNFPDVAAVAANIAEYFHGSYYGSPVEGTSAASPLWAAFTALVNEQSMFVRSTPVGYLNPALYTIGTGQNYANCFHDITSGNSFNGQNQTYWTAVQGYDLCTGLGSPNGTNLINALAGSQVITDISITPGSFSFNISSTAGPNWTVYSSSDLVNWTQAKTGSGAGSYMDPAVVGVTDRVYQVSGSYCCSEPVGFAHVSIAPGWALIANQFEEPDTTLNGLFSPMADGTYLPDSSLISTWVASRNTWGPTYAWTSAGGSGSWSPGASTNSLWPGQGFFLFNPGPTNLTITFAGLVRASTGGAEVAGAVALTTAVETPCSSIVPQPGKLASVLGYPASQGDRAYLWNPSTGTYDSYTNNASGWSPAEPELKTGQGFMIVPATSQTWNCYWLPFCN